MRKKLPFFIMYILLILAVSCSKKTADTNQTATKEAQKEGNTDMSAESVEKQKEPMPLPGFTPTGNNEVDAANYAKAKEDLYNNDPEGFKAWAESQESVSTQSASELGIPVQITEIPYSDYVNLPQARKDYIDAHPELFKIVK